MRAGSTDPFTLRILIAILALLFSGFAWLFILQARRTWRSDPRRALLTIGLTVLIGFAGALGFFFLFT
jgi:hypothetical protein